MEQLNKSKRKIYTTCRWLLGSIFLIFGLNGFYLFIPVPEFHPFMQLLVDSGYIYLIKTVEVAGGILLLANRWVPLALVILVVDIVNITFFHLLLDPRNGFIAVILIILWAILFYGYRKFFYYLLKMNIEPV